MKTNTIEKILKKGFSQMLLELLSEVSEVPSVTCTCGKPVVFIYPKTKFICTRCGAKWLLTVTATQTKKGKV